MAQCGVVHVTPSFNGNKASPILVSSEERSRLEIVGQYDRNDQELHAQLDRLAKLAAGVCQTPVGLVSIVMEDEQVFFGRSGTDLTQTPREWSFCDHAMRGDHCMIVTDATCDQRFRDNPLVVDSPGIRFYAGYPLKSLEGLPLGSFCVIDTKPRENLTAEQLESLETLALAAMGLLEKTRREAQHVTLQRNSSSRIATLERQFDILSDTMPQLVWMTDAEGRVEYTNRGWTDFVGCQPEESLGFGWLDMLHAEDKPAVRQVWQESVESCEPYDIEYRLRHNAGGYRWVLARGLPMMDNAQRVHGWIGTCTDVHEQRETLDRLDMLSRELNHRIKNIFAIIGGLISMSFRRESSEWRGKAMALQARVLALGRAHDFVRTPSGATSANQSRTMLRAMLDALLAPYQDEDGGRIEIQGEDSPIDDRSATPLALYFHELATNAAKYGALSTEDGHIAITIRIAGDDVEMEWIEHGGPTVVPSQEPGFGARLIEMSIVRQLGGTLSYDWQRAGLRVRARVPARAMIREQGELRGS